LVDRLSRRVSFDYGFGVDATDELGITRLSYFIRGGDISFIQKLLFEKANPNSPDIVTGWTPLIVASQENRVDLIELLCRFDADIDHASNFGITALQMAILMGHGEAALELLGRQSNPLCVNDNLQSALDIALQIFRVETVENFLLYLTPHVENYGSLLHAAAAIGNIVLFERSLEQSHRFAVFALR
jgi:ankyrin repeat protein